MATTEVEPILNIFTPARFVRPIEKIKPSRRDRLRKNKKQATDSDTPVIDKPATVPGQNNTDPDGETRLWRKSPSGKKSKPKDSSTYLQNFSSLFTSNPEIPKVTSLPVEKLSENVFSGKTFNCLNIHPFMVSNLEEKLGLKEMTSVQQSAVPVLLDGRDVLIKSQTGSGKTLAYAIPLVQHLQAKSPHISRSDGPYAVIIVPTRELALQSLDTIQKLVRPFSWLVPGCIMGGEKKKSEKARLRKGINILVATPGRLLDHVQTTQCLQLARVQWLVIDEADRLLELGFEQTVSQFITALNEQGCQMRQTALLSATLSSAVERLAGMSLRNAVNVNVALTSSVKKSTLDGATGAEDEEFATPDGLRHHFVVVPHKLRLVTLAAFLLSKTKFCNTKNKVVVFFSTQDCVEFHHNLLQTTLFSDDSEDQEFGDLMASDVFLFKLHGEMLQKDRTKAYLDFCQADSGILLCTDVAARGLDIACIRWSVQYSAPSRTTDYVHRAGRTARMASSGRALLFLAPTEAGYVRTLSAHKIQMEELTMDSILKQLMLPVGAASKAHKRKHHVHQTVEQCATSLQRKFELLVQQDKQTRTLARKAFQSYVRSYTTYPKALKSIFHVNQLHLGHVAKSFGLQDAPTNIGVIAGKYRKLDDRSHVRKSFHRDNGGQVVKHIVKPDAMSEFSSGFEAANGQRGKRKNVAKKNFSAAKKFKRTNKSSK